MGVQNYLHRLVDFGADAVSGGQLYAIGKDKVLHSNEPINKVGQALMSPLGLIGSIRKHGLQQGLKDVYTSPVIKNGKPVMKKITDANGNVKNVVDRELNVANIAGSAFTGGIGMGVLGGLTHDSSGNPDIAGIPGI